MCYSELSNTYRGHFAKFKENKPTMLPLSAWRALPAVASRHPREVAAVAVALAIPLAIHRLLRSRNAATPGGGGSCGGGDCGGSAGGGTASAGDALAAGESAGATVSTKSVDVPAVALSNGVGVPAVGFGTAFFVDGVRR